MHLKRSLDTLRVIGMDPGGGIRIHTSQLGMQCHRAVARQPRIELTSHLRIGRRQTRQPVDENPETVGDVERYMRSASSDAKSRVALMRLAWDFIGSEFGSRHQQYEKFYGGASFLVKQNVYRNFDFKRATALVDAALNLPPLAQP